MTFAAFLATIGSLILPWTFVSKTITFLAYKIIPDKETADFLVLDFLPDLKEATADIDLELKVKEDIALKFTGMLMKIMYAFVW